MEKLTVDFDAQKPGNTFESIAWQWYEALRKQGVPVTLHLYEKGEHGFLSAPPFDEWFGRCLYWMRSNG